MTGRTERPGFWHNAVAHPLLVLCPPLGEWLHARTPEVVPTRRGRRDAALTADGWIVEHTNGGPTAGAR